MDTLLEHKKAETGEKEFEGFDENDSTAEQTEEVGSEEETESRTEEDQESSGHEVSSATLSETVKENEVRVIVDQVVDKITPILQALCVTDRIAKAERNAEEWKSMAHLVMKNPHFTSKNLSIGAMVNETMPPRANMALMGRHPIEQTWEMFIQTPMATPVWTLIVKLELHPTLSTFTKWWKKIRSDNRNDTWTKLSKYIQSIRYYNSATDEFWRKYAVNPTYFSIQRIATELVTQANWLKASGLELPKIVDKYFDAAAAIASSSGIVEDVDRILTPLWPANFKPHRLHYENEPFSRAVLFAQEDEQLCDNSAQLKGFKFSRRSKDATEVMDTTTMSTETEMSQPTAPKAMNPKLSTVSKLIEEILNSK